MAEKINFMPFTTIWLCLFLLMAGCAFLASHPKLVEDVVKDGEKLVEDVIEDM